MKIITIGRATTNNVVLRDNQVSDTHAQIIIKPNNRYSIVDLNSTNGTYVNNVRINGETILNAYDVIKIGNNVIPWQELVNLSNKRAGIVASLPNYSNSHNVPYQSAKRQNSGGIFGYIVCCVVTAILIGGIMGLLMYSTSKSKQQQIEALNKHITELNEKIDDVETGATLDKNTLISDQLDLQEELEKQIAKLNETTGKLTDANNDNTELNKQINKINETVAQLKSNLQQVTTNLEETKSDLNQKEKDLTEEQNKLIAKEDELRRTQIELEDAQRELNEAKGDLDDSNKNEEKLRNEINTSNELIKAFQTKTIPELEQKIDERTKEVDRLTKEVNRLTKEVERLTNQSKVSDQTVGAGKSSETKTSEPTAN